MYAWVTDNTNICLSLYMYNWIFTFLHFFNSLSHFGGKNLPKTEKVALYSYEVRHENLSTINHPKSGDFMWFTIGASLAAFCLVPIMATRDQVIHLTLEWTIIFHGSWQIEIP